MEKYITDNCALYNGDCLEIMDMLIEKGIKVDTVITDIPYGTTSCAWDSVIPFDKMWDRLNRITKDNGAICLFGIEPFSSRLRLSNENMYRYDWYWHKTLCSNFVMGKKQPFFKIENISVFYKKRPIYNPDLKIGKPYIIKEKDIVQKGSQQNYCFSHKSNIKNEGFRYPDNLISFNSLGSGKLHPTQKPIALMEYLIKTYTNEGELVLDFTMGSGSTCIAARNTNRKVIGIELEKKYFDIAVSRYKDEEIIKESKKKEEKKEEGLKLASWKK